VVETPSDWRFILIRFLFSLSLLLTPTFSYALFFVPDALKFTALPEPDMSSFSVPQLTAAWTTQIASSRVDGSLDPQVLLSLNLEASAAWNHLAACNNGSLAFAREAYRNGRICADSSRRRAVRTTLEDLHRAVDQALESSQIHSVTLPVYAKDAASRSSLSLPAMHPFLMQMLLERIAFSAREDGREQLVAACGDSPDACRAQAGTGTVLVKAGPGKQALLNALVLVLESPPDCLARGIWPGLERPLFDVFRERTVGQDDFGFNGAMLLFHRECRFSAFTKKREPVSTSEQAPAGIGDFESDLASHYLFNQSRYVRALAGLWSRYL
jgi:hypothetical protein